MNIIAGSQSLVIVEFNDTANNPDYLETKEFLLHEMCLTNKMLESRCHRDCIILYKGYEYDQWKSHMNI